MKKTLIVAIAVSFMAVSASGQTSQRIFDNFDTAGGVRIVTPAAPTPAPAAKTKKTKRGSLRRTAQVAVTGAPESVGLKNNLVNTAPYMKLTMSAGSNLGGFTTGNPLFDSYIVDSARRYSIDPLLIYAQMHQESSFKLKATSHKGASGLMQLMPATARRFGVTDIYDPKQNIDAGVKYMRWLLNTFGGDVVLALAGYNAGEGAVWKYGNRVPPYRETQEYVRRITARYNSISNPNYVKTVKKVSPQQALVLEKKEAKPLTVYEPDPLAIKMPGGKVRLVNQ